MENYQTGQAYFHTFLFSFMHYYNKGLGEGFPVVHHGQDHIYVERGASFIRRNALECEKQSMRSESAVCQDSCASGTYSVLPYTIYQKMRTSKQPSLLWQSDYNIIQYGVCLWKLKLTLFVLWICIEKINLNHLCNKKQFLFAAIQWHLNSNCTLCSQNVQYNSSYLLKPWA